MISPCPHLTLPSPRLLSPFLSDGSPKLLLTETEPAAADIAAFSHGVRTSPGPTDSSSLCLWCCLRGFLPPHWGGRRAAEPEGRSSAALSARGLGAFCSSLVFPLAPAPLPRSPYGSSRWPFHVAPDRRGWRRELCLPMDSGRKFAATSDALRQSQHLRRRARCPARRHA